jgi:hypothetical protein
MKITSRLTVMVAALAIALSGALPAHAQSILLMMDDIAVADQQTYRDALTAASVTWDEWDLDTLSFPTAGELAPYYILIWADESTLSPGDADCQIVADWLASGGRRLFATSVDFMWDLENGAAGAGENNLYLMFQSTFQGDYAGTGIASLDGVSGDPVGGDWFGAPMAIAGTSDSNGDYADQATSAATMGLTYGAGGTGSGYAALTSYWDAGSTYATVWLGINFHNGIANQADRNTLMTNILSWFVTVPVELQSLTIE